MKMPFIVGENLYFRPLEMDDVETCQAWINNPELTQYLYSGRFPYNKMRETEWFEKLYKDDKSLHLAICLKDNDRHIGNCGLNRINWLDSWADFGILIGEKDCRGKGYGTEATKLMVDHCFTSLNLNRVELATFSFNDRAQRCYEKAGFTEEGRQRDKYYKHGKHHDEILMAILRKDWEKNRS